LGQQLLNAIFIGSIYALFAVGYALVFGILDILNLAHSAVFMLGAVITYSLVALHGLPFILAAVIAVLVCGLLGLLMASTFILYRQASAFQNLLEYPVWLVTGLLVPLALLPVWVTPIAWLLAPYWGMRAIRHSALGGDSLAAIGMCVALAAVYLVLGAVFLANFERLARKHATLSLT